MPDGPTVFISYAKEDAKYARMIHDDLLEAGACPWLDDECLLPGQDWGVAIASAIRGSKYFLALLSSSSVSGRGFVQKELSIALDVLDEVSEGNIFLIPARLCECEPSHSRLKDLHRVDMFRSWDDGMKKIKMAIGIAMPKSSPSMSGRTALISILNAGLKQFFDQIREAKTEKDREEAVVALRDYIAETKGTYRMSDIVFDVFVKDCIKNSEWLHPDSWATGRLMNMSDLPNETQQELFSYGLNRLLGMMDRKADEREAK